MGKGCCVHDGDACAVHGMLECGATVDGRCPFSGNATEQAVYCSSYAQDAPDGKTAEAWVDVKRKGELIYSRGGVTNLRESPVEVDATVRSDMLRGEKGVRVDLGGPYEVTLSKRSWENRNNVGGYVQGFLCECQWGQYHSGQPGSGWQGRLCFPPHEKVLMGDGSYKDICDVKIGDLVQTIDGAHEVIDTSCRHYSGNMVKLSFSGSCFDVTMTEDHPVVSNSTMEELLKLDGIERFSKRRGRARRSMESIDEWKDTKPASSIREGDLVLFSSVTDTVDTGSIKLSSMFDDVISVDGYAYQVSKFENDSHGGRWRTLCKTNDEIPFSDDLAYLLGWYTAEGSIEGRNGKFHIVRWSLSKNETDVADRICSILRSFGCDNPTIADYSQHGSIAVKVSSGPLAELFVALCGKNAKEKVLSREIMLAGTDFQRAFIEAYCAGDGTSKGNGSDISTSSESLARQISLVIQRVYGVDATVYCNANKPGPGKRKCAGDRQGVIYHIGFGTDYVQKRYKVDRFHTAHRVTDVSTSQYDGDVYNLTVDENHTYVVSGLTVHNCSHAYATALASGSRFRQDFMRDHESSRVSADGRRPYTCAEEFFNDVVEATYCGDEGARRRVAAMGREAVDDMRRGMRLRRASEDECVATWGGLSRKVATRRISADEMRELEHEIDGKELRNRGKLKMQAPDAATDDDFLWM